MQKDIKEIFKDLGFKPYQDLPELEQKEVNEATSKTALKPSGYWWRKLSTNEWDWANIELKEEDPDAQNGGTI
jgi:hypothetical protein